MSDVSDPRGPYERAVTQTESIIAAVRPDQLDLPTPCAEYDVRALISHVVDGMNRTAHSGEGGSMADAPAPAPVEEVTADGGIAAYRQARTRVSTVWADDAKLDAMVEVPWGKVPGRGALAGYTLEVLIHGWDLAKATGQPTELDEELAGHVLEFARKILPEQPRGGDIPFGPVVPTPPDAGTYAQLAGWLGRQP